jgi:hypothetical protein
MGVKESCFAELYLAKECLSPHKSDMTDIRNEKNDYSPSLKEEGKEGEQISARI